MANHQINQIGIPSIQQDGRGVSLVLKAQDGSDITLTIRSDDLATIIERLIDALDAAKVSKALWPGEAEEGKELKAAPTVYQVTGIDFVTQPGGDLRYIVLRTPKGEEVLIGLQPDQVRALMARMQEVQSIQTDPLDGPAN